MPRRAHPKRKEQGRPQASNDPPPLFVVSERTGRIGYLTKIGTFAYLDEVHPGCLWNLLRRLDKHGHRDGKRWHTVREELTRRGVLKPGQEITFTKRGDPSQ
jgi:hypothetical protein